MTVPNAKAAKQERAKLARKAGELKRNPDDLVAASELHRLRTEYRAARAAEYIERVVDAAPPLTNEQRCQLALLLAPRGAA